MFTHPGIHKEDIKAEIRKRGKTLRQLSLDVGLSEASVRCALIKSIPRADKAISDFINIPLHIIWPERYDADGNKIKPPRKPYTRHSKQNSNASHCKKSDAPAPESKNHDA